MKDIDFSVQDIKDLIAALAKNHMSSLKIQQGTFTLEIEGADILPVQTVQSVQTVAAVTATAAAPAAVPEYTGNVVKSPIVGTFYASPSPEKLPYVTVGSQVKRGDVLFIIESMKLMNEVTSEFDGTVTEILTNNAQAVEYGQPVMVIA